MKSWREAQLKDLIKIEHGFAFKGEYFSESGHYVVLTPGNFHEEGGFRSRPGKDRFYQGKIPERYILRRSDLIVAMTEQGEGLLGSAAFIPESDKYLHNQRLGLVRINPKITDRTFLYYLFNMDVVRQQIRNSSSGTKVRHTSPERIYAVKIELPDLDIQKKIAAILSAYDDLIENNKRRIALLEKMAEEIYCEWFVRMRFPGHKKVKFVKGVPEGWEVRPIASISGEIRKGVKKKDLSDSEKYLGLEHIPREQITIIESATGDSVESNKLLFQERDILFAKIRPYLHKVALVHFSGACSSDAIVIRPKSREFEGFLLFTVFSKTFIELATTASKGTKMPRADWDFLKKLEIKIPDDELLEAFQRHFDKAFTQIINLVKSNEILAASRDRLLPRLISGKLCVEDLDIHFPPSMHEQTTAEQLELDFPHA